MAGFSEQQQEILDDALVAFKEGCNGATGGGNCSFAGDFAAAFDEHYSGILKKHEGEIVEARAADASPWRAALQAVRDTGAKAAEIAQKRPASGAVEISAADFNAAWAEVESQKLGSNWCGVTSAKPTA